MKNRPVSGFFGRLSQKDDGATAVEFALLAPTYLLMIFLIVEFGRLGFTIAALNYAAEETTRYAIVREGTTEALTGNLQTYAASQVPFLDLNTANFTATKTATVGTDSTGTCNVTVDVVYTYTPWLPVKGVSFDISASSHGFLSFTTGDDETCD